MISTFQIPFHSSFIDVSTIRRCVVSIDVSREHITSFVWVQKYAYLRACFHADAPLSRLFHAQYGADVKFRNVSRLSRVT
jgi:hypothetical protein